jgi:hypothetical protein
MELGSTSYSLLANHPLWKRAHAAYVSKSRWSKSSSQQLGIGIGLSLVLLAARRSAHSHCTCGLAFIRIFIRICWHPVQAPRLVMGSWPHLDPIPRRLNYLIPVAMSWPASSRIKARIRPLRQLARCCVAVAVARAGDSWLALVPV